MKKRVFSILICTLLAAGNLAAFSACGQSTALSSIEKTKVAGAYFYASHGWDLISASGVSTMEYPMGEEVSYRYAFSNDTFRFDGTKMSENSEEAVGSGARYEGNFSFYRQGRTYLSETFFLDEQQKEFTSEDTLYVMPVSIKDGVSSWFSGISPASLPQNYSSPSEWTKLFLTKMSNLAFAAKQTKTGNFVSNEEGFSYEVDLSALYSPWIEKGEEFLSSLTANTTLGEIFKSDFMRERYLVFLGNESAADYFSSVKKLFEISSPIGNLSFNENLFDSLKNFPTPKKNEKAYSYALRALEIPFQSGTLAEATLFDLFSDADLLLTKTLVPRMRECFLEPFSKTVAARYADGDEKKFSFEFSKNGTFTGVKWVKRKTVAYGLYTMENTYSFSLELFSSSPRLVDIQNCKLGKLSKIVTE